MSSNNKKDLNELIRRGQREGWQVTKLKASHFKWVHPWGGMFFTSSSPSDRRAIRIIEKEIAKKTDVPNRGR